ncbi:hypothetical protein [Corynebacterium aquatimens]|uniref:Uncharacterized protein n=1 Tax=Corynebacterium aquatimens TaxID=1190508 RepID=A0A931DVQ2_9CORY|nr:hypothetical protein [Corynebacterium aquatimens]MBG6122394.1 hypothetical protein [Corynebacterium aquatimens]
MTEIMDETVSFETGDYRFSGQDRGDYHVHAAALFSNATHLLTTNRASDFTGTAEWEPYEIISPDEFFILLAELDARAFSQAVAGQFEYHEIQGRTVGSMVDALKLAGCDTFAERVRRELTGISE